MPHDGEASLVPPGPPDPQPLLLTVVSPSGETQVVPVSRSPFRIGRLPECDLSLRDNRISRDHAQILLEDGRYFVEDRKSRHGVFVNGRRVERQRLRPRDRIEFGVPESYHVVVGRESEPLRPLIRQVVEMPALSQAGDLGRLSAVLEVARALQSSLSLEDVLTTAVDAALVVTGAERGFLMLRDPQGELEVKVARDRNGSDLPEGELRVPRGVIRKALFERRDLLSMAFDPASGGQDDAAAAGHTVVALDLRSVFCVPLVRIRVGQQHETSHLSPKQDTLGVLYLDSREMSQDLSAGNRELLQSLAIEISTVLENARLLTEERQKNDIEQELRIARDIQKSMLPPQLPEQGWLVAAGCSEACFEVGGDYYDVMQLSPERWAAVLTDVSGKGVSAALLASLLQGAFFATANAEADLAEIVSRVNLYLCERARHSRFATVFYCRLQREGTLDWVNAGHTPTLLVRSNGDIEDLSPNATPVGLFADGEFPQQESVLLPGDKVVIYSDGVLDAENGKGERFGEERLRAAVTRHAPLSTQALFDALLDEIHAFSQNARQKDDLTMLVLGYQG